MFDKNYFLDQLRNGVKMDDMGQALADAMNAAQEAYDAEIEAAKAEKAKAEKANAEKTYAKRELASNLINLVRDYGKLVAPETADILDQDDAADIETMVQMLDEMFNTLATMAKLKTALESTTPKIPKTDEDILANFIASLM